MSFNDMWEAHNARGKNETEFEARYMELLSAGTHRDLLAAFQNKDAADNRFARYARFAHSQLGFAAALDHEDVHLDVCFYGESAVGLSDTATAARGGAASGGGGTANNRRFSVHSSVQWGDATSKISGQVVSSAAAAMVDDAPAVVLNTKKSSGARVRISGVDSVRLFAKHARCTNSAVAACLRERGSLAVQAVKKQPIPGHHHSHVVHGFRVHLNAERPTDCAELISCWESYACPVFLFRFKRRCSFELRNVRVDLSCVKQAHGRTLTSSGVMSENNAYELEVEALPGATREDFLEVLAILHAAVEYFPLVPTADSTRRVSVPGNSAAAGPNPVSFKPSHLSHLWCEPYVVASKTDGVRVTVFIHDRRAWVRFPRQNTGTDLGITLGPSDDPPDGSVFDGEFVSQIQNNNSTTSTGSGITVSRSVYALVLFDAYFWGESDLRTQSLVVRLSHALRAANSLSVATSDERNVFGSGTERDLLIWLKRMWWCPAPREQKEFSDLVAGGHVACDDMSTCIEQCVQRGAEIATERQNYVVKSDGLVFTPQGSLIGLSGAPEHVCTDASGWCTRALTWSRLVKWKPPETLSVDFAVWAPLHTSVSEPPPAAAAAGFFKAHLAELLDGDDAWILEQPVCLYTSRAELTMSDWLANGTELRALASARALCARARATGAGAFICGNERDCHRVALSSSAAAIVELVLVSAWSDSPNGSSWSMCPESYLAFLKNDTSSSSAEIYTLWRALRVRTDKLVPNNENVAIENAALSMVPVRLDDLLRHTDTTTSETVTALFSLLDSSATAFCAHQTRYKSDTHDKSQLLDMTRAHQRVKSRAIRRAAASVAAHFGNAIGSRHHHHHPGFSRRWLRVLDMACGRWGDVKTYTDARELGGCIERYIGLEQSENELFDARNGALCRLLEPGMTVSQEHRHRYLFLQADCSLPIDAAGSCFTSTSKASAGMREMYSVVWGGSGTDRAISVPAHAQSWRGVGVRARFHLCSLQFALHYFCADPVSLGTLAANISSNLLPGGILVGTCFDAALVKKHLGLFSVPGKASVQHTHGSSGALLWRIEALQTADGTIATCWDETRFLRVFVASIGDHIVEPLVNFDSVNQVFAAHGLDSDGPNVPFNEAMQQEGDFALPALENRPFSFCNCIFFYKKREQAAFNM